MLLCFEIAVKISVWYIHIKCKNDSESARKTKKTDKTVKAYLNFVMTEFDTPIKNRVNINDKALNNILNEHDQPINELQ